jgi:predicted DNA-binding protein YlxM (UPF0122 family)
MSRKSILTKRQTIKLIKLYKDPSVRMEKLCKIFQVSDDTIVRTIKKTDVSLRKTVGFSNEKIAIGKVVCRDTMQKTLR